MVYLFYGNGPITGEVFYAASASSIYVNFAIYIKLHIGMQLQIKTREQLVALIKATYKLSLLVAAALTALVLEFRQSSFGETYAKELQKIHSELSLEAVDFSDERSFVIFEVSLGETPNATSDEYINTLASDVTTVYCNLLAKGQHDLKIKLFNINVRTVSALSNQYSGIIFSRALSNSNCI